MSGEFVEITQVLAARPGTDETDPKKLKVKESYSFIEGLLHIFKFAMSGRIVRGGSPSVLLEWVRGGLEHVNACIDHLRVHDLSDVMRFDGVARFEADRVQSPWAFGDTVASRSLKMRPRQFNKQRGKRSLSKPSRSYPAKKQRFDSDDDERSQKESSSALCNYYRDDL